MLNRYVMLTQFDGDVLMLKIEMSTGHRQVLKTRDMSGADTSFGMFEVESDQQGSPTVALMATPKGPLIIFNGEFYYPNEEKTTIEIKDGKSESHMQILDGGVHVFGLFYKEKFGIGLHPYNRNREDIDFYYFLKTKINDPMLYKTYTKDINYFDCGPIRKNDGQT